MPPNTNIISHSFYTQSAFRFGEWYGHMGLFPVLDDMNNRTEKVKSSDSREILRDWLAEYFVKHGARYEFKVRTSSHHTSACSVPSLIPAVDPTGHIARTPSHRRWVCGMGRGHCALPDNCRHWISTTRRVDS
jgi:hypothetical protein